jgi:hypothetical protein
MRCWAALPWLSSFFCFVLIHIIRGEKLNRKWMRINANISGAKGGTVFSHKRAQGTQKCGACFLTADFADEYGCFNRKWTQINANISGFLIFVSICVYLRFKNAV